ncbi:hypothetical protein [Secundilactobacillus silagei]|uniref:Uncharacterized protein n=1 Tax=Secundilactobacillus silagei JCM 19001 TaxID=1302250 RepID=A0A1Z5IKV9_9LACO|nr:hypothetical protein [Secundilactobacillus silagei]TDG71495.1 hypothetical protein C5L25_000885 [Secundilactobacillus silagei JCM 19001]GAX02222.1 hypothetical protein IWT126_02287 [Secundilactobacillus silagei JCM 19001]
MSLFKHAKSVKIPKEILNTETWISDDQLKKAFFEESNEIKLNVAEDFLEPTETVWKSSVNLQTASQSTVSVNSTSEFDLDLFSYLINETGENDSEEYQIFDTTVNSHNTKGEQIKLKQSTLRATAA